MRLVKKILLILLVGFIVYYLVMQPTGAAEAVRTVFGAIARAFTSIMTFFSALAG